MKKKIWFCFAFILLLFSLAGCGSEESRAVREESQIVRAETQEIQAEVPAVPEKPQEIVVFAAASLTESFGELAGEFEKLEDGKTKVVFNFAGSQVLKTSVENGAKADLFASANIKYMEELKEKGFVSGSSIFAKNKLVLIRNRNSGYSVKELGDLAADGMKIAVGDESVPVGMYWEQALDMASDNGGLTAGERSGIESNVKTRELNVKDVVSKVVLNEVDVGVVYRTDVTGSVAEKVEEVELPVFEAFDSDYPAAVLKESEGNAAAVRFYDFLLSDKGKEILKKYGFITGD